MVITQLHPHQAYSATNSHQKRPISFALVVDDWERICWAPWLCPTRHIQSHRRLDRQTLPGNHTEIGLWRECSWPLHAPRLHTKSAHQILHHATNPPHAWIAPTDGPKVQHIEPIDTSKSILPNEKTHLQEIVGTLFHYTSAMPSIQPYLLHLEPNKPMELKPPPKLSHNYSTLARHTQIPPHNMLQAKGISLSTAVTPPTYLSAAKIYSWTSTLLFLSDKSLDITPNPEAEQPPRNGGAVHIHCITIMKAIILPDTKAKTDAVFNSGKETAPLQIAPLKWTTHNKQFKSKQIMPVHLESATRPSNRNNWWQLWTCDSTGSEIAWYKDTSTKYTVLAKGQ